MGRPYMPCSDRCAPRADEAGLGAAAATHQGWLIVQYEHDYLLPMVRGRLLLEPVLSWEGYLPELVYSLMLVGKSARNSRRRPAMLLT